MSEPSNNSNTNHKRNFGEGGKDKSIDGTMLEFSPKRGCVEPEKVGPLIRIDKFNQFKKGGYKHNGFRFRQPTAQLNFKNEKQSCTTLNGFGNGDLISRRLMIIEPTLNTLPFCSKALSEDRESRIYIHHGYAQSLQGQQNWNPYLLSYIQEIPTHPVYIPHVRHAIPYTVPHAYWYKNCTSNA